MKKSFVAVITYEDDDDSPMDLSSLATWVEGSMMCQGVRNLDVTTFHTSTDATFANGPIEKTQIITSARKLELSDGSGMRELCVRLDSGPERLLHTYFPPEATFDEQSMVGKSLEEAYAFTETLAPMGVTK